MPKIRERERERERWLVKRLCAAGKVLFITRWFLFLI
jgi:hypothetical protein